MLKPRLRGWVHLAAVPVALVGAVLIVLQADGSVGARVSALVFGICLVGLYTTSSLYHVGRWSERVRGRLRRCDGAMIQLTIAGTFTPIAFHALSGAWRWWSLTLAWLIAGTGAAVAAAPRPGPRWLGAGGGIAVGWLAAVPVAKIASAVPWEASGLIVLGGVLYTIGGVVWARRRPDPVPRWFGYHEIFHVLVVAASAVHYAAIWSLLP